jgi:hypothetical protein
MRWRTRCRRRADAQAKDAASRASHACLRDACVRVMMPPAGCTRATPPFDFTFDARHAAYAAGALIAAISISMPLAAIDYAFADYYADSRLPHTPHFLSISPFRRHAFDDAFRRHIFDAFHAMIAFTPLIAAFAISRH